MKNKILILLAVVFCIIIYYSINKQVKTKVATNRNHHYMEDKGFPLDLIEKEMISYFKPEKINIASFGNYVPHVHFHVMARFKEDSYFPEPMWGKKQRDANLTLPSFEDFYEMIKKKF